MFTDPIADMLTRIRNAQMVKKTEVFLPYSKLKLNILKLLENEGWVSNIEVIKGIPTKSKKVNEEKDLRFDRIKLNIIYSNNQPKLKSLKRISKPGRRVYVTKDDLPSVLNGWGIAVISTPKGLMTNKQAKKENVGGEVICEIY
jgi:small subunit ribosomal protein S8